MTVTVLTEASAGAPSLTGQAGSLISVLDYCLVTTLGWTKPYSSGTTIASYRQPAGSNQFYLRVDDTGTTGARVRGFETMSSHTPGSDTGGFPLDAQQSGGAYLYKSSTANSTARPWTFVSDGKCFHLFLAVDTGTGARTSGTWYHYFFGDIYSYKSGDVYNTLLVADMGATASVGTAAGNLFSSHYGYVTSTGVWAPRAHTQIGSAIVASKFFDAAGFADITAANTMGTSQGLAYPAPIDGGLHLSKVWVGETAGRRGVLPGLWALLHVDSGSIVNLDTFSGSGDLSGKSFQYLRLGGGAARLAIETSNTWSI